MKECVRSLRIGIALGGGGARGVAHLGVLSALGEAGIPIHVVSGTSFGAVIGAMYSTDPDCRKIRDRLFQFFQSPLLKDTRREFLRLDHQEGSDLSPFLKLKHSIQRGVFYGLSLTRNAYISEEKFSQLAEQLIDQVTIEQTRIPLSISAANLTTGQETVLKKGPLRKAVCATCALPGIFPPVRYGDDLLMDGGWVNPVPAGLARQAGADFVIAVDTSAQMHSSDPLDTGLDILRRADSVSRSILTREMLQKADVVIRPDVSSMHWADFSHAETCILKGEEAARDKLQEIRRVMRRRRIRKLLCG